MGAVFPKSDVHKKKYNKKKHVHDSNVICDCRKIHIISSFSLLFPGGILQGTMILYQGQTSLSIPI